MTYRGTIKDGVVVLEGKTDLADGTPVLVEPIQERPLMELARKLEDSPPPADWPEDGASQVDHYLYGTPKQDQ